MRADAAAAREREAEARARRGVWLRDEEPGVTSIGGRLDVLDGRIVDERLHQISERLKARYPGLDHSARRAKALSLAMNPELVLTILEADQPALGLRRPGAAGAAWRGRGAAFPGRRPAQAVP
ncbi:hypothetical protein QH948_04535 [Tessaracoccus lacteus]|uniref:DUF222 domain-containing protein n=1 Tax=Tessaracoccus lacteus TaxID=3041766 RepID=A0ABY8Q152_9ACTN|nr:hypothetical protein [Tessaracoccus sp. T21]WGT48512.1 hypothetical protein QH948_04535 [Tessaracoccus sp. T21]